jgi:hypothetical protein
MQANTRNHGAKDLKERKKIFSKIDDDQIYLDVYNKNHEILQNASECAAGSIAL